jgi:hypothetical protein
MLVAFSLPEFNLKKQISWAFHIDDHSESSRTYDMIMGQDLLGESGIIINFNDHTVTWDTDNCYYSNERQRHFIISRGPDWDHVYMSANEPQTLKDEYSRATKILDAEYKPASLDDVIKTCENLHVEEQHQLKELLQKYEHMFDGTLGEFNMEYGTN